MKYLDIIGANSKKAFNKLNNTDYLRINRTLESYSKLLQQNKNLIIKENIKDVKSSKRKHLIDRLILDEKKIDAMRSSISEVIKFKNPIGRILAKWRRPNGLKIEKISTPIGIIGVIYESRPNVTSDVASLCLKSGNCAILRGGSESFNSNKILANIFRNALSINNIDKNTIQFIDKKDRKIVDYLLSKMTKYIDVIVPRGGKNLVKKVQRLSKIHVIGHLEGVCHIYVDNNSSLDMASKIITNAKMRRPSICGAVETVLINSKSLKTHAIPIIDKLTSAGCSVVVDKKINKLLKNKYTLAKEIDWKTEYLDSIISIKIVENINDAISHIKKYGTNHTESIITNSKKNAQKFINEVTSSIVMHNTSTQFADGYEFGLGAEVGISTNKLHPRGPVGLEQLTSYKYVVKGKGQIRT